MNITGLSSTGGNGMNLTQQQMQITPNSMQMAQNPTQMPYNSMQMSQNPSLGFTNMMNILRQFQDMQGNIANKGYMSFKQSSKNRAGKKRPGNTIQPLSKCVWVTGIPENYKDADMLMNIFGNFGNVIKVKFAKKKLDGATIEMDCHRAASKVCEVLNDVKLDGLKLSVQLTPLEAVSIQESDSKSKEYVKADGVWRFSSNRKTKSVRSKFRHLTPTIIVRNIPKGKFDDLKKYIIEAGFTVKSIGEPTRTVAKEKKDSEPQFFTAVVEFGSIEEAVGAMAKLHNSWPQDFGEKIEKIGNILISNLNFEFARLFEE